MQVRHLFSLPVAALLLSVQAVDASLVLPKSQYAVGEQVVLSFEDQKSGSEVYLYQDAALLPMIEVDTIMAPKGEMWLSTDLEQGKYRVEVVYDKQKVDSAFFTIEELPLPSGSHSFLLMTDIHVMHPDLIINDGSALQRVIEGDRKMLRQSAEVFAHLIDTALAYKPEFVLVPGDLTKDGEKIGHEMVAAGLKRLEDAGIRVFVIPGNHDVENPNASYFNYEERTPADEVSDKDFMSIYSAFGYDPKEALQDPSSMSYMAELWDGVFLFGIDATRWYDNTHISRGDASDNCVGYGRLREQTKRWIFERADSLRREGKVAFAMMHHQMIEHFDQQSELMSSAAIENGGEIAREFMEHGLHLLFTGHMHVSNISVAYNTEKTDSLVEVSTGAPVSYPSPYRWISTNDDLSRVDIITRQIHSLDTIDDFQLFGRKEMEGKVSKLMRSVMNMFSTEVISHKQQMESVPLVGDLIKALPDSPSEMSDLIMPYMQEPSTLAILTTSEGNENLKLTDNIINMVYDGYDRLIDDLAQKNGFTQKQVYVYKTDVKNMIVKMLEAPVYSILQDCTNRGNEYENTTNDLFVNLKLPYHIERTGVEDLTNDKKDSADTYWYDLQGRQYPSMPEQTGVYIHQGKKIMIRYEK